MRSCSDFNGAVDLVPVPRLDVLVDVNTFNITGAWTPGSKPSSSELARCPKSSLTRNAQPRSVLPPLAPADSTTPAPGAGRIEDSFVYSYQRGDECRFNDVNRTDIFAFSDKADFTTPPNANKYGCIDAASSGDPSCSKGTHEPVQAMPPTPAPSHGTSLTPGVVVGVTVALQLL